MTDTVNEALCMQTMGRSKRIDLTNPNMLELRDMTARERRAIEAAWWDGKTVEQFCGSEWCKKDSNVFSGRAIYRVVETPMQVPWDMLADWIMCVVINQNGTTTGWEKRPTPFPDGFYKNGGEYVCLDHLKFPRGNMDTPWHQSLVTRPGTKA